MAQEPASGHEGAEPRAAITAEEAVGGRFGRPYMLTDEQFQQLLNAVERRRDALSVPELTKEQKAMVEGFRKTAQAMGVSSFVFNPPGIIREDLVLVVKPPAGTRRLRIFFQSGVKTFDSKEEGGQFWLPNGTPVTDRIARLEYLDANGAVLGFTGGEVKKQSPKGQ